MSFNTALTGLKAASIDLQVTGNNIANASTVGFKQSRTEFGDVYAQTTMGLSNAAVGSGVIVQKVSQQFQQGSVSFTDNSLDLAITGNGFFIVDSNGERQYTRAGAFGVDKDGYIVSSSNSKLQGFLADEAGNVGGVLGNLQVVQSVQQPHQTTMVEMNVNLDATEPVLARVGATISTTGTSIAVPQVGLSMPTTTTWLTEGVPRSTGVPVAITSDVATTYPITIDSASDNHQFILNIAGDATTLTIPDGTYTTTDEFVSALNYAIVAGGLGNQVIASENGGGEIEFTSQGITGVDGSSLSISNVDNMFTNLGWTTFTTTPPSTGSEMAHPAGFNFQSIPGTGYAIESSAGAPLSTTIVASNPGTQSELVGDMVLGTNLEDYSVAPFSFTLASGTNVDQIDVNTDMTGYTVAQVVTDLNTEIATTSLAGILQAQDNGMGGISFRNVDPGSDRIYISSSTANASNASVETVFGMDVGFVSGDSGEPVVEGNNQINIELAGTYNVGPVTITMNENKTYTDMGDVAAELQSQIDNTPLLAGRLTVSSIGSRIRLEHALESSGEQIYVTNVTGTLGATNLGLTAPAIVDLGSEPETRSAEFRLTMSSSEISENNGSIIISLDRNIHSVTDLADEINSQINTASDPIGVQAVATLNEEGNYQLSFIALDSGEDSVISVDAVRAVGTSISDADVFSYLQFDEDTRSTGGIAAVDNGYPEQRIEITDLDGNTSTYIAGAGTSAAEVASDLSRYTGISATATTEVTIPAAGYVNNSNDLIVTLNGVDLDEDSLEDLALKINELSVTSLIGFEATITDAGDLHIMHQTGRDIAISIESLNTSDELALYGNDPADMVNLSILSGDLAATVGGSIDIVMDEGVVLENPNPVITGLFGRLTEDAFTPFELNAFDPNNPASYNHSTSINIYDSSGVSHILTQYFVKQEYEPGNPLAPANSWIMYVQIDNQNVGDPDPSLPPPQNSEPTVASFNMRFNADGSLNTEQSDEILISNWTPLDSNGDPSGALTGQPILDGGGLPIEMPPVSSNFTISFNDSTQFGDSFSISDIDQDGYTTGRLTTVDIDADGVLSARFTNGQSEVLGQLALAGFNNVQGLESRGDTAWVETFDSGEPLVGAAGTSALGDVNAGALEESNVDLSAQLVRLIVAQRNFQANAKTIETVNQVTQSIINI